VWSAEPAITGVADNSVIIVIADGLGTDALDRALRRGNVPALARLREEGGHHVITTSFPSVTGVAYVPLLTGRFPGAVGVPGLRWYDRTRRLSRWLGSSRSYVGLQVRAIDRDLAAEVPTAWELAPGASLGLFGMLARGLPRRDRIDRGPGVAIRGIHAHVTGDVAGWQRLESRLADRFAARVRRERPRLAVAALASGDKAAHAQGADGAGAARALQLVDELVGRLRHEAEQDGRWTSTHLWVVSDHGHSAISGHYELANAVRSAGFRVRAHPWTLPDRAEVAVMVSGNGMAHVYLDLGHTQRRQWPVIEPRWGSALAVVLDHPAVDLVARVLGPDVVEVVRRGHGRARISRRGDRYDHQPLDGDPLAVGAVLGACAEELHERTAASAYPDSVVQLASLVLARRAGDLVISASRDWDLRAACEPIDHVSSHGALHAAHMRVPFLASHRPRGVPRRTTDLFASLVEVLGVKAGSLDGDSFV
jgi:hypothetical protein